MPTPRSNEVSVYVMLPIREAMEREGLSFEKLLEGLPFSPSHFYDLKNVIDWDAFVLLLERFERMAGGPEAIARLGEQGPTLPSNAWFSRIAAYVADSRQIYWGVIRILGPRYFRRVSFQYTELGERQVRIKMRIPPDLKGSTQFFHIWLGAWRATPRLLGQKDALIEAQITPHRATYTITCPPSLTLINRSKRAWRMLFSARAAIEQLSAQEDEIRAEYDARIEAQRALTEREVKLQLSTQLAGLAKMSALGEMTSGIAHEINNPLAVIHLRSELLNGLVKKGNCAPEELRPHIDMIRDTSMRIAAIVKGLRAFSRNADQDRYELRPVFRIIDETLQLCGDMFNSLGARVETTLGDPELEIECRPVQVSQTLLNLLSNSVDAIRDLPERWIRVDARQTGAMVEISVTDSGPGIPPAIRDKIFQPFFTTKEAGHGTGLGLSISRGLIEAHGGSVEYDELSRNTRFVIKLPHRQAQPGLRTASQEPKPSGKHKDRSQPV